MSLAHKLIETPEREKAATSDRYEYQTLWGLALLLEQHGAADDYAVVFEFHDDVALLDSESEPSKVRFYQVKTRKKSEAWLLSTMVHRAKSRDGQTSQKPSIVDKMFDNIEKFHPHVLSVDFVSNQSCAFGAGKPTFRFSECAAADFNKIIDRIIEKYPSASNNQFHLLGFTHTDLSLADMISHTKGKLQTFIAKHLGEVTFNPESVFRAIVDDCRRRANTTRTFDSLQEVVREKGLTKANVQEWLNGITLNSRAPNWKDIEPTINLPFAEARRVSQEYNIYRAIALDTSDRGSAAVRAAILRHLGGGILEITGELVVVLDSTINAVEEVARKFLSPFSLARLKAMIIYETYTYSEA